MPRLSYSSLVKGSPDVLQLLVSFTDDTPVIIVIIIIIVHWPAAPHYSL